MENYIKLISDPENAKWEGITMHLPLYVHGKTGDEMVKGLIGLLSNKSIDREKQTFSEELELLAKLLKAVSEAIVDNDISETEAKVLIKYMVSHVVSNRVSNIFDQVITSREEPNWFIAAKKSYKVHDQ